MNKCILLVAGVVLGTSLANAAGISYTCDSTVASIDGSGVCAYLDTTIASLYSGTFTNANAKIYITTTGSGLGESEQVTQTVTYATYYNALKAESTDTTAVSSLTSSEPGIFGGADVGLTAALVNALNIPSSSVSGGEIVGVYEDQANSSDPLNGTECSLPSTNCYNGVIAIVTPAGLSSETSGQQGLWFRDVAGTAGGAQPALDYDYFSIVQHETDELLGTASCTDIESGPTAVNNCPGNGPSAVDLFRYSAPGTRVYNSLTNAYFSPNGGVTDTDGNNYNSTVANDDYADFSSSCKFVQDATGCLGKSFNITNDYASGTGPEIQILNAVGYDLTSVAAPEPGTIVLFGSCLAALGAYRRVRRA